MDAQTFRNGHVLQKGSIAFEHGSLFFFSHEGKSHRLYFDHSPKASDSSSLLSALA